MFAKLLFSSHGCEGQKASMNVAADSRLMQEGEKGGGEKWQSGQWVKLS